MYAPEPLQWLGIWPPVTKSHPCAEFTHPTDQWFISNGVDAGLLLGTAEVLEARLCSRPGAHVVTS